jgi:hypothetical protein
MLEIFFFVLGLINALLLISIFLIRRKHLALLMRYGWIYLLLAIPAVFGIFLVSFEHKPIQYSIFLGIFLLYLLMELLLDHVFKINFREDWQKNWKWMLPYLILYYAMNYGFVVMPWKSSLIWGLTMAVLFAIQLITNLMSHPRSKGSSRTSN